MPDDKPLLGDYAHELVMDAERLKAATEEVAEHVAKEDLSAALTVLGLLHHKLDALRTNAGALQQDLQDRGVRPSFEQGP